MVPLVSIALSRALSRKRLAPRTHKRARLFWIRLRIVKTQVKEKARATTGTASNKERPLRPRQRNLRGIAFAARPYCERVVVNTSRFSAPNPLLHVSLKRKCELSQGYTRTGGKISTLEEQVRKWSRENVTRDFLVVFTNTFFFVPPQIALTVLDNL